VKVLVYSIPHIEVLGNYPLPDNQEPLPVKWLTNTFKDPLLPQICSDLLGNYKLEDSEAAQALKARLNAHSSGHWQVIIGTHFKYALNSEELQGVLYGKHKDFGVLVFRQPGLKRTVNWRGIGTWSVSVVGAFLLFLGVIGMLRCESEKESWLCRHHSTCLYLGLSYVFSKAFKKLVYRKSKTS
jgi:hypothetical protein